MEKLEFTPKTDFEIKQYQETNSSYIDYKRFEGNAKVRKNEQDAFINNEKYTPDYDYPKLDELAFDQKTTEKKSEIYEAVLELEAAKQNPDYDPEELELYAGFHENRLKKIMLVEAARNIADPLFKSDSETDRRAFAELNESLYGKFNKHFYLGILDTEKQNLNNFQPKNSLAEQIKSELEYYLDNIDTNGEKEVDILSDEDLNRLHEYATDRYSKILDVVPNTSDDVYYGVDDCVRIMNDALEAGGLSQFGWKVSENPEKTAPATNGDSKSIYLPSNTKRNASELKRLIIHEQEVHARRSQNGEATGINVIKKGTAEYADAEDGLAVMMECAVSGKLENASFDRARNRYIAAGLALGVDGQPRDARETYEILWRMLSVQSAKDGEISDKISKKAKETAYTHIENAYRGTQFWMKGVIYTKLKIYYEGLVANAEMFKNNINNLDEAFDKAFIGKYDHTNSVETELVERVVQSKAAKHLDL